MKDTYRKNKKTLPSLKQGSLDVKGIMLFLLVTVFCVFALVMLYSASAYTAVNKYSDAFYYVKKQSVALLIGLVCMVLMSFAKVDIIKKFSVPLLVVSYVLLIIIFIPSVGVESYGAKRWLDLGFITIQPSEIAKFGLIAFSAYCFDKRSASTLRGGLPVLICGLTMCVLLLLEPNMSVTILTASLMLAMLFLGGATFKQFSFIVLPLLAAAIVLVVAEPYRMQRLLAFLDPWASPKGEGYQLIQSYYALGSGGWFGVGLFNSRQKYMFLPFAESDFVFSIVGEELGFIGALLTLIVLCLISCLGFSIAYNAATRYEGLLAYGISSVISLQTLINIAVVTGTIPPTGIPLPFMSFGGSSLVCFLTAVGILLCVNKNSKKAFILEGIPKNFAGE